MRIKKYKNDLIIICSFILVLSFFINYLFEPFRIPTASMEPNVAKGDFIIANKFTYGLSLPFFNRVIYEGEKIKRGDVIVFKNRWDRNKLYVKRVIGLPGELIEIKNKVVAIDNIPIVQSVNKRIDSDYLINIENGKYILFMDKNYKNLSYKKIKIPKNHYFVLGDNRDNSFDSRNFGTISIDDIQGKVLGVWFSINWNSKYLSIYERLFRML